MALALNAVAFFSCENNTSENTNESADDAEIEALVGGDELGETASLREASIIAQDFVKRSFSTDCDFDDLDYRGEETATPGRFKVYQKFTSSMTGVEREYVYKIFIQYYGGEWEDAKNWDYGKLIVEDTGTGRQWVYNGTMKQKDAAEVDKGEETVAGVTFKIKHQKNTDKFITTERLSKKKLIECAKIIEKEHPQVSFYTESNSNEDYAAIAGGILSIYFGGGDVVNLKKAP